MLDSVPRYDALWRSLSGKGEIFSRHSIRYSLSVLVTSERSSDFLLYKRSEQYYQDEEEGGLTLDTVPRF